MPDHIVIGAGIVGLAAAHALRAAGAGVTLIDRDFEGDRASYGNAGGIAVTEVVPASVPGIAWRVPGWLLDPLGPLAVRPAHAVRLIPWLWRFAKVGTTGEAERIADALAAINARVYDDLLPLLDDIGMAGELNRVGALTVYETDAAFARDRHEWSMKRARGIEVEELSGDAVRAMEPALGPVVARGVFTPQWSHVDDPKRLVEALHARVVGREARTVRGEVVDIRTDGPDKVDVVLAGGRTVSGSRAVVAAGAWSAALARRLGDRVLLESERGYNTTVADPGVRLTREIIFAEKKFVATPMSCGLRIGGAAEFGGLQAVADYRRSQNLGKLARRYLPGLRETAGVDWAGHRPTTPDSLPVIGRARSHPAVVYAFGHGHLGLTQAATTARLVTDLALDRPPAIPIGPYAVERFN